jgi:hypothetical protein
MKYGQIFSRYIVFLLGDLCEVGRDDRVLMSIFIAILLPVYSVICYFLQFDPLQCWS